MLVNKFGIVKAPLLSCFIAIYPRAVDLCVEILSWILKKRALAYHALLLCASTAPARLQTVPGSVLVNKLGIARTPLLGCLVSICSQMDSRKRGNCQSPPPRLFTRHLLSHITLVNNVGIVKPPPPSV
jgi:hypothetical protein